MTDERTTYKVFKGLQKPLEFIGLQGRYIWHALGGGIGTIFLTLILLIAFNFWVAIIAFLSLSSSIAFWIARNMKKGLHSKKRDEGVYIVTSVIQCKAHFHEQKKEAGCSISDH